MKYSVNGLVKLLLLVLLTGCNGKNEHGGNRLRLAASPYLQEHADNPVDWYEWGEEALAKAKAENKPLLISIGYAACHWCHEMEKESFMDTAVARVMNENFVCIKVDREERPDIDQVYMNALQLLTGEGGWPLNAFALPDGQPFFAGTYYTKSSWLKLLASVSKAYATKSKLVATQAQATVNGVAANERWLLDTTLSGFAAEKGMPVVGLFDSIYHQSDNRNGGLRGSEKFPTPAYAEYLLQQYYITHNSKALEQLTLTLRNMALGGMYDHIGGGFARYTTDSLWQIPHFEKMLYDNAQLASVYAHAFQLTGNVFFRTVMDQTLAFMEKELAAPSGGYYSSLNADTEEGEGYYYTWQEPDFLNAIRNDRLVAQYYHVTGKPNWKQNGYILHASQTPAEFSAAAGINSDSFSNRLQRARTNLALVREKRRKPSTDTKIITAWNGMVIRAFADASAATGNSAYLAKAAACAGFTGRHLYTTGGQLQRIYKDGKAQVTAFLDDYAWQVSGLLRLYELSFHHTWLVQAKRLADDALQHFNNDGTGLLYYADQSNKLVLRKTEIYDDAIPSSNAVFAESLLKLGVLFDDTAYAHRGRQMVASVLPRVQKLARYHLKWAALAERLAARNYEVAIMGEASLQRNAAIQRYYLPATVFMGSQSGEPLPLMKNKLVKGKTYIYVCTDRLCRRPEQDAAAAAAQMKQR